MLPIQLWKSVCKSDVKLRRIGILAAVGHAQQSFLVVLQLQTRLLVVEFAAVYGVS